MATTASAVETGNASVQAAEDKPILRDGVWMGFGLTGQTEYFEFHNPTGTLRVLSAENMIGLGGNFDYDRATGIYTVSLGCVSNVETWELTSNNGRIATLSTSDGNGYSLFYLGTGSAGDFFSLSRLNEMSKNYFAAVNGSANDVCIDSRLIPNCSGLAEVTVYARDTMRQVIVDTYTISVRTGVGTDSNGNTIDFSEFE